MISIVANAREKEIFDLAVDMIREKMIAGYTPADSVKAGKSLMEAAFEMERHLTFLRRHKNTPEGMIACANRMLEDAQLILAAQQPAA
ncbi:hypothetical protein [Paraburkholderia caledonica]|uniref:Uncharacterized protein n=1 Tax=Paraburkholderia caledonica TaxID=134536 RepID=A0AB73IPR0_9BURK|nr:hypothetical protein [Paraburkholderia caledonica]